MQKIAYMVENYVGTDVEGFARGIADVGDADAVGGMEQGVICGERGFLLVVFWSIETAGERPSMESRSGLSICPRNMRA